MIYEHDHNDKGASEAAWLTLRIEIPKMLKGVFTCIYFYIRAHRQHRGQSHAHQEEDQLLPMMRENRIHCNTKRHTGGED